ncbi:CPBP family intramembrane glutamic endopeptidase [Nocardiopsis valliformis]|uniref:CPBP family intramembrane glutamic endopeptidase n=1 Tax=Nocardiopsis valliformis TaxID=239974 RepID=UPI001268FACE|nr:CPBP family intramembrane glutamic endopeptidase [Nocardiopsis valliformis]
MNSPPVNSGPGRGKAPLREISIFVLLAFGLAWLVFTPLILNGTPPTDPAFGTATHIYVFTPAVAALLVTLFVWRPGNVARALALTPLRPLRRVAGYSLLGFVVFVLLPGLALLAAVALGVAPLDPENFSGLREVLAERAPDAVLPETGFPTEVYLAVLGGLLLFFPLTFLLYFGEELGWRGYLLPRLLPLGVWPALLISGLIHGLWHSPQLYIHTTLGDMPLVGHLSFLVSVVLYGIILGWLRLASRSVWPAVFGHAATIAFLPVFGATLMHADGPTHPGLYPGGNGGLIGLVVVGLVALGTTLLLRNRVAGDGVPPGDDDAVISGGEPRGAASGG